MTRAGIQQRFFYFLHHHTGIQKKAAIERGDVGTGGVWSIDAKFLICNNPIYISSEFIPVSCIQDELVHRRVKKKNSKKKKTP